MPKVCVVIGYGPGVGDAVARRWSAGGYTVALVSRNLDKLEAASKGIPNSKAFACDATDSAKVTSTLSAIEANLGPIEALVYNAGNGVWKTFDQVTIEQMDLAMKLNVYGLLAACQYLVPKMVERGSGFICITGATASLRGMPFTSVFAAAKAGQRSLAQSVARQVWNKGVHVAYAIIDARVGNEDGQMAPKSIAEAYWQLQEEPKDCWTFQRHLQVYASDMSLL